MNPKKAYLISWHPATFALHVLPVMVIALEGETARVVYLKTGPGAAILSGFSSVTPSRVFVSDLASTRAKALALIADKLRDIESLEIGQFAELATRECAAAYLRTAARKAPKAA